MAWRCWLADKRYLYLVQLAKITWTPPSNTLYSEISLNMAIFFFFLHVGLYPLTDLCKSLQRSCCQVFWSQKTSSATSSCLQTIETRISYTMNHAPSSSKSYPLTRQSSVISDSTLCYWQGPGWGKWPVTISRRRPRWPTPWTRKKHGITPPLPKSFFIRPGNWELLSTNL